MYTVRVQKERGATFVSLMLETSEVILAVFYKGKPTVSITASEGYWQAAENLPPTPAACAKYLKARYCD